LLISDLLVLQLSGRGKSKDSAEIFFALLISDLLEPLNHLGAENQDWSRNIFCRAVFDGSGLQRSGSRQTRILGGTFIGSPSSTVWEEKNKSLGPKLVRNIPRRFRFSTIWAEKIKKTVEWDFVFVPRRRKSF